MPKKSDRQVLLSDLDALLIQLAAHERINLKNLKK